MRRDLGRSAEPIFEIYGNACIGKESGRSARISRDLASHESRFCARQRSAHERFKHATFSACSHPLGDCLHFLNSHDSCKALALLRIEQLAREMCAAVRHPSVEGRVDEVAALVLRREHAREAKVASHRLASVREEIGGIRRAACARALGGRHVARDEVRALLRTE